jgi:uncharacterized protein DUF3108/tetratricopeptide repeat protein
MRTLRIGWLILGALLATGGTARAQSVSDLLQKGIYTQETVGDLDAAIKIYRQILTTAKETRSYAAQAQYRLGLCLLQKGDQAEAVKAFEKLIADYPEETELVAKARERIPGETKLLPAPYSEGEMLEMRLRLPAGMPFGTMVYAVGARPAAAPNAVTIEGRNYIGNMTPFVSRVEADRESMRPLTSDWDNPGLGRYLTKYQGRQARVESDVKPAFSVDLTGTVYDNEEAVYVMRRLPLAVGYKTSLPIFSAPGGACMTVKLEVTGIEDVQTPFGKVRSYKVRLDPMRQTFWFSADASRYLVKFDANAVYAELVAVRRADSMTPSVVGDDKFSFTLPAGWLHARQDANVFLLDPEVQGSAWIWADAAKRTDKAEVAKALLADAEDKVKGRVQALKNYKVRQETWRALQINGQPAFTYMADYTETNKPMVEQITWVGSESATTLFILRVEAAKFESFRKRIEPAIESMKVR